MTAARRMPPRLARLLDRAVDLRLSVVIHASDSQVDAAFTDRRKVGVVRVVWSWHDFLERWKHQASTTTVSRLGPDAHQEIKLTDVWAELGVLAGGER